MEKKDILVLVTLCILGILIKAIISGCGDAPSRTASSVTSSGSSSPSPESQGGTISLTISKIHSGAQSVRVDLFDSSFNPLETRVVSVGSSSNSGKNVIRNATVEFQVNSSGIYWIDTSAYTQGDGTGVLISYRRTGVNVQSGQPGNVTASLGASIAGGGTFQPPTVYIQQGDTLYWINNSGTAADLKIYVDPPVSAHLLPEDPNNPILMDPNSPIQNSDYIFGYTFGSISTYVQGYTMELYSDPNSPLPQSRGFVKVSPAGYVPSSVNLTVTSLYPTIKAVKVVISDPNNINVGETLLPPESPYGTFPLDPGPYDFDSWGYSDPNAIDPLTAISFKGKKVNVTTGQAIDVTARLGVTLLPNLTGTTSYPATTYVEPGSALYWTNSDIQNRRIRIYGADPNNPTSPVDSPIIINDPNSTANEWGYTFLKPSPPSGYSFLIYDESFSDVLGSGCVIVQTPVYHGEAHKKSHK